VRRRAMNCATPCSIAIVSPARTAEAAGRRWAYACRCTTACGWRSVRQPLSALQRLPRGVARSLGPSHDLDEPLTPDQEPVYVVDPHLWSPSSLKRDPMMLEPTMYDYPFAQDEIHVDSADSIAINNHVLARISLSGGLCRGDVSFSDVAITKAISFAEGHIQGKLLLARTGSLGPASFCSSSLEGDVQFRECDLRGTLQFEDASVRGNLSLAECRLYQTASFDSSSYRGTITIERCELRQDLQFQGSAVAGAVVVRQSALYGTARFDESNYQGGLSLLQCRLEQGATFQRGDYQAGLYISHVAVHGDLELSEVRLEGELQISDCQLDGGLSLRRGNFDLGIRFHSLTASDLYLNELRCGAPLEVREINVRGNLDLAQGLYEGPVSLLPATVGGGLSLKEAALRANVTFADALIAGPATFAGGLYEGDTRFQGVTFAAEADFRSVLYRAGAEFESVVFQKSAIFNGVEIGAHVTFRDVTFKGRATFTSSRADKILFERVTFEDEVVVDASLDAGVIELRRVTFAGQTRLSLHHCRVLLTDCKFAGPSTILGDFYGEGDSDGTRLLDVSGSDMTNVVLVNVDLRACQLSRAYNLDKLRLDTVAISLAQTPESISWQGTPPFLRAWTRRRTIPEEVQYRLTVGGSRQWSNLAGAAEGTQTLDPAQIASTYRQLRKSREDAKDEPGAADFYYGEMEMRRTSAQSSRAERIVLWLYWVTCGYGLRASRALACLATVVVVGAILSRSHGFRTTSGWSTAIVYALEATTKLIAPTRTELTLWGRVIDLALRLAGPIFIGLAVLSIRARTKR
jgi:uncharacterized protein YjbI with pentapeptide repeats